MLIDRPSGRPCGPMDKAPNYESGDCRFESCKGHIFVNIM